MTGPLMFDIEGTELSAEDRELLLNPAIGGLILFSRNFDTPLQVTDLVASIRELRPALLVAVDQEGGRVQRFKEGFTALPAMQMLGDIYKTDQNNALSLAAACGWVMASEVRSCGINLSFAPVVDIDCDYSSIIGDRAFSDCADTVTRLATAFIDGMHNAGMAAVGKHFPGHGAVQGDSHLMTPIDDRPFDAITERELMPFAELNKLKRLDGIMPAHVVYSQCDEKPAVFSTFWLQQVLRKQLGFEGVIFSDDLSMEGASMIGDFPERTRQALDAGCDMVLICNNREEVIRVLDNCQQILERSCAESGSRFDAFLKPFLSLDMSAIKKDVRYLKCQQAGLFE